MKTPENKGYTKAMTALALVAAVALGAALPTYAETASSVSVSVQTSANGADGADGAAGEDGRDGVQGRSSVSVQATTTAKFREFKEEVDGRITEIKTNIMEKRSLSASSSASLRTGIAANADFRAALEARRRAALAEFMRSREALKARVETMKEKMGDRDDEARVRLSVEAKNRVIMHLNVMIARFNRIADIFGAASDRLADRIEKLQDEGADMDGSVELLAQADAKLAAAEDDIAKADVELKKEVGTETSKESIKAYVKTAKESLLAARDAYKDVIESIRVEIKAHAEANASSTVSN